MLSTSIIKNAAQASNYFMERDDYYTKEGENFDKPSIWYGKGADKLKLNGVVDKEIFNQLLAGKLLNGVQIGVTKSGEVRHRAGFDLTLSVPKSWSIAHYATKDPIFAQITEQAAKLTADLIERDCAMASQYKNGRQDAELTGNLVFAFHFHRLSRELDMQDHVHMNVMNVTQRNDGQWRALKSDDPKKPIHDYSEGFLERVRARKKHYGDIFSLHIAHLAQKHSLAVRFDKQGKWELKGISKEMIETFSTRRKQIEQQMQAMGVHSANAAEVANLATRQKKQKLSKQEIEENLNERLAQFPAIQMQQLQAEQAKESKITGENSEKNIAIEAINYAIAHLSETADVITEEKILVCAMKQYHAKPSVQSLLSAIVAKEQNKELFVISDNGTRRYVSALHVKQEKEILQHIPVLVACANAQPVKDRKLQKWLNKTSYVLNAEQKNLISNTLKSNALIHLIDTKTRHDSQTSHLLAESAKYSGFEAIILCISKKEAEDGQLSTKIPCMSVSQYLYQIQAQQNIAKSHNRRLNLSKQLLVIENAHRLSTKQGHALTSLQTRYQNRCILLHDSKQPQSLQPGNFIQLLAQNGIKVEKLGSDIKQINPITVDRFEVSEKPARLEQIASDYVSHQKNAPQSHILMLAQNKIDVEWLNQRVQTKLLAQGLLSKHHYATMHYQPVFLTTAQRTQATQYKEGQMVSFTKSYRSLSIEKQVLYRVEALNVKNNQVLLKEGKKRILWDPSKIAGAREGVTRVFAPKPITLHQGDRVVSTHSCNGTTKGSAMTVIEVKNNKIFLKDERQRKIKLKSSDPRLHHLALGYACTASTAHSKSPNVVLAEQAANSRMTHTKQHYQVLSQATNKVVLYTDDSKQHDLTLARYKGEAKPVVSYLVEKLSAQQNEQVEQNTLNKIMQAEQILTKRERYLANDIAESTTFKSTTRMDVRKLVHHHIAQLSDSEAVITKHALEHSIASHNAKMHAQLDMQKLDKELNILVKKGVLIPCKLKGNEPSYTNKRSLKIEAEILQEARACINAKPAFYNSNELTQKLSAWQEEHKKLTHSQQKAVKQLLTTNDKLILINGLAGVGKTTLLEAAKALLAEKQVSLIGLAPTNEATRQLQVRGIQAHTLDSYLNQLSKSKKDGSFDAKAKSLLVLDEASMASSQKFRQLLSLTNGSNLSMAFVGDVKQLPSIEQGKMFWMLQKFGIDTTLVNEIVRQKENPALLKIINNIYRGDYKNAIESLDKRGCVMDDNKILNESPILNKEDNTKLREARLKKLVDIVSSYSPEKRDNTCVITPANRDRNDFNQLFREVLKQKQKIGRTGSQSQVFVPSDLSPSAKAHAGNYHAGQVLRFNTSMVDCDIQRGDYLTVKEVNLKNNYLVLENEQGEKTGINAARFRGTNSKNVSVYNHEQRELCKNDLIRWRHTDLELNRINMQQAKVLEVQENQAIVQLDNKQTQVFHLTNNRNQHWDYAYASTVYSEQGNTKQHAVLYMLSDQRNLASQPGFLVAMTRAVESGLLVTDDKDKLIQRIEQNTAVKTSALEALNYQPSAKNIQAVNSQASNHQNLSMDINPKAKSNEQPTHHNNDGNNTEPRREIKKELELTA